MNTLKLASLAAGVALAIPALAAAQSAPPPPPGDMAPHHAWAGERGEEAHGMAHHLKALHDVLGIRPDQEAAFQAYAAARRPPSHADGWKREGAREDGPDPMTAMTTPERLDRMAQMMDQRETRRRAAFERRAAATKALYAALSPEQRHTLDALPALEGHGDHGWGRGGEHPMGPPPPPPQ